MILSAADFLLLNESGITRTYSAGKVIYLDDTGISYLFLLQKGIVKVTHCNRNDKEVMCYFIKPGDVFGELNLFTEPPKGGRYEIAITMEESEICIVPIEQVKVLINKHEGFRMSMMRVLGHRFRKTEEQVFSISFKSVQERVLDFIKDFAIEFGKPIKNGYAVRNILTHEDIAKAASTTRQTTTTILTQLKRKGVIDYNYRTIRFYDSDHGLIANSPQKNPLVAV